MIVSGVRLDPSSHASATASLADRLADLDRRRGAAEAAVEGLLLSWRGEAAAAFRTQWDAWSSAAASVVDDLGASVAALAAARCDLTAADESSGPRSRELEGRLG